MNMKAKTIICAAMAAANAAAVLAARGDAHPLVTRPPVMHGCRLVFSGYEGTEALKDFPALVKIPDGLAGFDYRDSTADGGDVCFFGADGRMLAHEIDTWNPEGDSYVWVRVPEVTKATAITAKWGGPAHPVEDFAFSSHGWLLAAREERRAKVA